MYFKLGINENLETSDENYIRKVLNKEYKLEFLI